MIPKTIISCLLVFIKLLILLTPTRADFSQSCEQVCLSSIVYGQVKTRIALIHFFRSVPGKNFLNPFCDIQNNQGLAKGYQPKPKAQADNPYRDLDYSGYHIESNNCFIM